MHNLERKKQIPLYPRIIIGTNSLRCQGKFIHSVYSQSDSLIKAENKSGGNSPIPGGHADVTCGEFGIEITFPPPR